MEVQTESNRVVVRIRDDGPGTDPATFGGTASILHSTKPDGTGLGLPIARRIATAHGGDLRIESVSDDGTTVVVTLPKVQSQSSEATPSS